MNQEEFYKDKYFEQIEKRFDVLEQKVDKLTSKVIYIYGYAFGISAVVTLIINIYFKARNLN